MRLPFTTDQFLDVFARYNGICNGLSCQRRLIYRSRACLNMKTILGFLMLTCCLSAPAMAQRGSGHLPDPKLTPGDAFDVSRDNVCNSGYSNPARNLSIALKRQAFDRYGTSPRLVGYNVDHLIPVSLGGSNSITNLWPQPLSGEWNYTMKNKLERKLYKMVCSGAITLERARQEIAGDWVSAYKKYQRSR